MSRTTTPKCPACRQKCTYNGAYQADEGWWECRTEYCDLFGLEGFPHHWRALGRVYTRAKRLQARVKELEPRAMAARER